MKKIESFNFEIIGSMLNDLYFTDNETIGLYLSGECY